MLIADTNILVRCSRGRALRRVRALIERGVIVATTENNLQELWRLLVGKLGLADEAASEEIELLLEHLRLISWSDYGHLEHVASDRLREGGLPDWPALAAALAFDAGIWSDDVDYFGVGVPIWSTPNVYLAQTGEV